MSTSSTARSSKRARFGSGRELLAFDIEAQKLLGTADNAGLRDGGQRTSDHAEGVHAGAVEDGGQLGLFAVRTPEAGKEASAAETGEVHGNVGGAARAFVASRVPKHRDGCLGRDAINFAVYVAIEHEIADDQHPDLVEAAFEQLQNCVHIAEHRRVSLLGLIIALLGDGV